LKPQVADEDEAEPILAMLFSRKNFFKNGFDQTPVQTFLFWTQ